MTASSESDARTTSATLGSAFTQSSSQITQEKKAKKGEIKKEWTYFQTKNSTMKKQVNQY